MQPQAKSIVLTLIIILLTACSPATAVAPTKPPLSSFIILTPQGQLTPSTHSDSFSDLPDEARVATRPGDPRPPAYWVLWNSCAPDNRADVAAANGGRASGWVLLDDLIADPGIQLGDYPVITCEAGLDMLLVRTATGKQLDDPVYLLASALLAAELNLNIGAETCPIAEETVIGAHLVLSNVGINNIGGYIATPSVEIASAIPRLLELLDGYNRGQLCR